MGSGLTEGAIERIMIGDQLDNPVVQVLGIKKMTGSGGNGVDRYRMLLSDGLFTHSSAMLATQLNEWVERDEISAFCILQLNKYMCNTIQGDRKVIIILEVSVLQPGGEVGAKIGNPAAYKPGTPGGAAGPESRSADTTTTTTKESDAASGPAVNRNFYNQPANNKPQASPAQSRMTTPNKRPINVPGPQNTPGGTPIRVHPINSLTPYQNRWTIRARVTQKQAIKNYSNARGAGKLFNMVVTDESGDIRVTGFNDQVDKFYEMIELNNIYYISKGSLKTANKQYNTTSNDYELTLNNDSTIVLCEEEVDLPTMKFNFIPINQLEQHQENNIIDIIGVVKSMEEITTIIGKATQKEFKKRELNLVDDSKVQVRLTLWGQEAETFEADGNPIVAVKGAKVSGFGGRSLSAPSASQLIVNPNIPEAHQLRGWFDSVGHTENYDEYRSEGGGGGGSGAGSNWKTFADIKSATNFGEKGDYFTTKATVVFMKKENCMYNACPSADCNKKVVDQGNGTYRCEKCNKEYPDFKHRLMLQMNLADHTDNQWVTCFHDTAETVLNAPAAEIGAMRDNDENAFQNLFQEVTFKSFVFRMRAKMETYNDETRLRTVVVQANPINWIDFSQHLIKEIDSLVAS